MFKRVIAYEVVDASQAVSGIADHPQYQAIALPQLVAEGSVDQLSEIAANAKLADTVRLGAIEGLARIASPAADGHLVTIGKDESADEELRKAAWRGLRRAKRVQAKGTMS
jgi:ParB family chromosome partitioning protein